MGQCGLPEEKKLATDEKQRQQNVITMSAEIACYATNL